MADAHAGEEESRYTCESVGVSTMKSESLKVKTVTRLKAKKESPVSKREKRGAALQRQM